MDKSRGIEPRPTLEPSSARRFCRHFGGCRERPPLNPPRVRGHGKSERREMPGYNATRRGSPRLALGTPCAVLMVKGSRTPLHSASARVSPRSPRWREQMAISPCARPCAYSRGHGETKNGANCAMRYRGPCRAGGICWRQRCPPISTATPDTFRVNSCAPHSFLKIVQPQPGHFSFLETSPHLAHSRGGLPSERRAPLQLE